MGIHEGERMTAFVLRRRIAWEGARALTQLRDFTIQRPAQHMRHAETDQRHHTVMGLLRHAANAGGGIDYIIHNVPQVTRRAPRWST